MNEVLQETRGGEKLALKARIKKYFMCRKDYISDSHTLKLWMRMRKLLNENYSCCILLPVIAEKVPTRQTHLQKMSIKPSYKIKNCRQSLVKNAQ